MRRLLAVAVVAAALVPVAHATPAAALTGDPLCIDTVRSYTLQAFGSPGQTEQWLIDTDPLGLVSLSTSPTGTYTDSLLLNVTYPSSGTTLVTFFGKGVVSGTTTLTADGPFSQASLAIDVDRVTAVDIADLDDIGLAANPAAGGGVMKITDVDLADASQGAPLPATGAFDDARTVKIKATFENGTTGYPVYFKAFDVDDPSTDATLDPNGTDGNDNFGTPAQVVTPSTVTDADGFGRTNVKLPTQPGDNIKVVATCDPFLFNDLVVDGADVVHTDGTPLESDDGIASDMVTTWRRLHVEVDHMAPVEGNQIIATIASVSSRRGVSKVSLTGAIDSTNAPVNLATQTDAGEFENGLLTISSGVGAGSYPVIGNRRGTISVTGSIPAGAVGAQVRLVDDDNVGGGSLDGDEGDPVPAPDTSLLAAGSTSPSANVLAQAYIVVNYDLGGGEIPFPLNSPSDATTAYQYDWIAHDNDPNFWTAYLLGAYQPARGDDGDPDSDRRVVLGITDLANTGSVTFAETIRDRADPVFGICSAAGIVAHELAHLFGDTADLRDDGNGGLMSTSCGAGTTTLVGTSLRSIRSALHP